jgi:hypothetical protein
MFDEGNPSMLPQGRFYHCCVFVLSPLTGIQEYVLSVVLQL